MTFLALILCMNFVACSEDEQSTTYDSLKNTTWKITSITPSEYPIVGATITFHADQTLSFTPSDFDFGYSHYTVKGDTLRLTYGINNDDDYIEGVITINDNTATYQYYFENDLHSPNKGEATIVTLQKQ